MLIFIAISVLVMTLGCMISDKIEKMLGNPNDEEVKRQKNSVDIETLKILNDYGLINGEKI